MPSLEWWIAFFGFLASAWASWMTYKTRKWEVINRETAEITRETQNQVSKMKRDNREAFERLESAVNRGRVDRETEEQDLLDEIGRRLDGNRENKKEEN